MGGVGGERFKRFEQLCAQAFNVLREEADLFINLFALVSCSAVPLFRLSVVPFDWFEQLCAQACCARRRPSP